MAPLTTRGEVSFRNLGDGDILLTSFSFRGVLQIRLFDAPYQKIVHQPMKVVNGVLSAFDPATEAYAP